MKLIIAILHHTEGEETLRALIEAGFHVTRIASSGGFLRRGNATLLVGAPVDRVGLAVQLIREHSTPPLDPAFKSGTVFVLKTERYEEL
jgi:uncharacterized protein YaaQ